VARVLVGLLLLVLFAGLLVLALASWKSGGGIGESVDQALGWFDDARSAVVGASAATWILCGCLLAIGGAIWLVSRGSRY
jgi:hypothetical protein